MGMMVGIYLVEIVMGILLSMKILMRIYLMRIQIVKTAPTRWKKEGRRRKKGLEAARRLP